MKILAIETSCDETALAIIETKKIKSEINFEILASNISSQVAIHTQYGGVFPMMAKREHDKNIFSIFEKVLKKAKMHLPTRQGLVGRKKVEIIEEIEKILEKEPYLANIFINKITKIKKPEIDAIVITTGPGLEPALWVGINFAKALSFYWNIPIIPVNHMEGHIFSIFPKKGKTFKIDLSKKIFPMLSLLVSGGHTELILIRDWMKYKKIGQTRDDAAGEAFDKVARMLGLPYPGGPEISRLAEQARSGESRLVNSSRSGSSSPLIRGPEELVNRLKQISFPRPMIHSKDYDFSFSGLKTAVLYYIRDLKKNDLDILQNDKIRKRVAREFEDAVIEVLTFKTTKAIKEYKIKTLIVGGGVSANKYLQKTMLTNIKKNKLKTKVHFPTKKLTGDNAVMIAIAGYFQYKNKKTKRSINSIKAQGNLSL